MGDYLFIPHVMHARRLAAVEVFLLRAAWVVSVCAHLGAFTFAHDQPVFRALRDLPGLVVSSAHWQGYVWV